jgi:PAS domain S-box-containing protein
MNISYLLPPLATAGIGTVLLIVVLLKGRRQAAVYRIFSLLILSTILWALFIFAMRASPDVEQALRWDRAMMPIGFAVSLFYYHFSLSLTDIKKGRVLLLIGYLLLVVVAALIPTSFLIQRMEIYPYGYAPIIGPTLIPIFAFFYFLSIMAIYNLIKGYRTSHLDEERNRLLYITIAMVLPVIGAIFELFPTIYPTSIFGSIAFCLLTSVAILKYNLLDIRIIARKSLTYLLVSVLVAIPYVAILYSLHYIFEPQLVPWWVHPFIILVLAIVLRPLYSWAQNFVDRLFYRDRYDYLKALEQFSREAQSIVNLKELSSTLTQLVSSALRTSSSCLLLPSESDNGFVSASATRLGNPPSGVVLKNSSILIKWLKLQQRILTSEELNIVPQLQSLSLRERNNLEQIGAKLYIPISTAPDQLSGILILGQKLSQQTYSSEERQLLTALSGQMAMALENARLYAASQQEVAERKQAEQALRESEEKYRALVENSPNLVAVYQDGHFNYVNKAACSRFGWTYEELTSPSFDAAEKLVSEGSRYIVRENIAKRLRGEYVYPYEINMKTREGSEFPALVYGEMISYGGKPANQITFVDITERKRAEEELEQSREQLRDLSAHIESARETERTSIAREVHDELGQALTALKMDLSWLNKKLPREQEAQIKKIREMSELIGKTIQTVKRISTELRPGVLDDLGLMAAVEWQMQEFQERTQIKCEFTAKDEDINVDRDLATGIFRIFQEALTNVARHANATKVKVSLNETDGQLVLQVSDNGKGITTKQIAHPKSFGLIGMRERARSWNGSVKIEGILGKGTIVTVSIPLNQKEERDDKNTSS